MRFEFKLPDLAEGMVEGEVVTWLIEEGQSVQAEQPVVEMMTDKATVVITSPRAGNVLELLYGAGDIAPVGTTLFVLDVASDGSTADQEQEAATAPDPNETKKAKKPNGANVDSKEKEAKVALQAPTPERTSTRVPRGAGKALATPATRRLARELGVDIGLVSGTGSAGRVSKEDVVNFSKGPAATPAPSAAPPSTAAPKAPTLARPPASAQGAPEEREERIPIRGLRRAIYETMTRSKTTAAHFTYVDEVECTNLVQARQRLRPAAEAAGVRLNYLPFIAKAVLLSLRAFPKMNASVDDAAGEIVMKGHHHLGIAAATDAGLTVPVVRHASNLTLLRLASEIAALGEKARTNSLSPQDLGGSTFTLTSLGKLGGLLATPIINHPEVAILGVHLMEPRAVVRDGEIVARQMMNISLSFDHRVIDGHEGAAFAAQIKRYLEDPELMMLEMV
jgi:pyruvate dehydrogenase E2 component (dihydrolipoamide acetyltransferase)